MQNFILLFMELWIWFKKISETIFIHWMNSVNTL